MSAVRPPSPRRRPTSAPMLNRYILFYSLFSSSFFFYLPMGYPSRPHASADRNPPLVRDSHLLIPALRGRRLHGRLGGQSPAVGLQNLHQPRTVPSHAATSLRGHESTKGSRPVMEPAPLALESCWLNRVRPACDGGIASTRRRPDRRGPWRRWRARAQPSPSRTSACRWRADSHSGS